MQQQKKEDIYKRIIDFSSNYFFEKNGDEIELINNVLHTYFYYNKNVNSLEEAKEIMFEYFKDLDNWRFRDWSSFEDEEVPCVDGIIINFDLHVKEPYFSFMYILSNKFLDIHGLQIIVNDDQTKIIGFIIEMF